MVRKIWWSDIPCIFSSLVRHVCRMNLPPPPENGCFNCKMVRNMRHYCPTPPPPLKGPCPTEIARLEGQRGVSHRLTVTSSEKGIAFSGRIAATASPMAALCPANQESLNSPGPMKGCYKNFRTENFEGDLAHPDNPGMIPGQSRYNSGSLHGVGADGVGVKFPIFAVNCCCLPLSFRRSREKQRKRGKMRRKRGKMRKKGENV